MAVKKLRGGNHPTVGSSMLLNIVENNLNLVDMTHFVKGNAVYMS